MPKEEIDVLNRARVVLIAARRRWANLLIEPFDHDQRPDIAANFVKIQEAIDAVDRAIVDEQRQGK